MQLFDVKQQCEAVMMDRLSNFEKTLYKKLKSGKLEVKVSYRTFLCPYCPENKKKVGLYIDILQHASGVGNSKSKKRSVTDKASHRALAKYLIKDLAHYATTRISKRLKARTAFTPAESGNTLPVYDDQFEKLVWPWKGNGTFFVKAHLLCHYKYRISTMWIYIASTNRSCVCGWDRRFG